MSVKISSGLYDKVKKVALVTGSASGIGANIAVDLAVAGYYVIVTGRNTKKLSKVVELCGNNVDAFEADLNNLEQVDKLIEFIHKKFNRLDVLVNNACWRGNVQNVLADGAHSELNLVMQINVSIPMYLVCKCLLPLRRQSSERAVVINISSIASQRVVPLHLYSISKACLTEMSRQLAQMSETMGIFSVTISPGPVLTEERPHHKNFGRQTLLNRVATTQDITNLVIFVLTKPSLFNGKELNIDGGMLAKEVTDDAYNVASRS